MPRVKKKSVRSFALTFQTLEALREVAEEAKVVGGQSGIAEDALSAWISRYRKDPAGWLASRRVPVHGAPVDDL